MASALLASVLLFLKPDKAIAGVIPVQADFGGASVRLLVGNPSPGGGAGIIAPTSIVKAYTTSPTISLDVNGYSQCSGFGNDYLDPGDTRFEIYATDANENRVGTPRDVINSNAGGCSATTNNGNLTATHPGPRSALIGHTQYYVWIFEAQVLGSSFGWNTFFLDGPGVTLGYSDNSGERFALKSSFVIGGPEVAEYADYTVRFGVPCEITTAVSRTIRWFDADQGEINQARTISFDIYDDTTNTYLVQGLTALGGQNQSGSRVLTFQPSHQYRWIWRDVSSHNGIQMQVPFDSIYYNTVCATPPALTCGNISTSVTTPEPGQPFTVTVGFSTSGGTGPNVPYQVFHTLAAAGVNNQLIQSSTMPRVGSRTVTSPPVVANAPGTHAGNFRVVMPDASNNPLTCPYTVVVAAKPYFRAYGGDVSTGAGFGAACPVDPAAGIIGFNRGANPYTGAGTQLAAYALGTIVDFASGNIRAPNDPNHLSFASTTTYGGGLSPNYATCAQDYFSQATGTLTGNVTIPARTLAMGERVTVFVDGNATITGNITFPGGSYANIDQIPSYRLVVRGNIYVAPAVTRLDGIFIAQPSGGSGGRFYTCWNGAIPTPADLGGPCRSRLTVFGAVIAETIKLTRTIGTQGESTTAERYNAGGNPAEVFIFSPEVWMGGELNSGGGVFDSINVMPPIL